MQILHSPIYEVPGRAFFLCQTNIKCMYAIDALVKKLIRYILCEKTSRMEKMQTTVQVATFLLNDNNTLEYVLQGAKRCEDA